MNASVTHRLIEQGPCKLSGDGWCDSPGYNAKNLSYSLINQETNDIIAFSITQVTVAGNSNRIEKLGLQKTLNEVREKQIVIKQLTADRHADSEILKRGQTTKQQSVWHFSKNITSKLIGEGKKSYCTALQKQTKFIINHFW